MIKEKIEELYFQEFIIFIRLCERSPDSRINANQDEENMIIYYNKDPIAKVYHYEDHIWIRTLPTAMKGFGDISKMTLAKNIYRHHIRKFKTLSEQTKELI